MLFNSIDFLVLFLPFTLLGFYCIGRLNSNARLLWLVLASLAFYAYWEPRYLVLLLSSAAFNYFLALGMERVQGSLLVRYLLTLGVLVNLLLLAYFKYAVFILDNIAALLSIQFDSPDIVLPLAISFFTFQQIAYLADVSTGTLPERSPVKYVLFVAFFPQLIAGPIVHHKEMMPQFVSPIKSDLSAAVAAGLVLIVLGLSKKLLLADTLARFVDPAFASADSGVNLSFLEAWIGAISYTLQLYFDFSGYCDIALGSALLFGIRLPINFHSPLKSSSIIEFWRLWHMTLSRFLRDYLYIPLGGNRLGVARRYLNLLTTMLLGGLWHGANWTFVAWGSLHGLFLMINHAWRRYFPALESIQGNWIYRLTSTAITFFAVVIAFVVFRADSIDAAFHYLSSLFDLDVLYFGEDYVAGVSALFSSDIVEPLIAIFGAEKLVIAVVFLSLAVTFYFPNSMELVSAGKLGWTFPTCSFGESNNAFLRKNRLAWLMILSFLGWASLNSLTSLSPFLYFQF